MTSASDRYRQVVPWWGPAARGALTVAGRRCLVVTGLRSLSKTVTQRSDLPIGRRYRQALRIPTKRCPHRALGVGVEGRMPSCAAALRGLTTCRLDTALHGFFSCGFDTQAEKVVASDETT